MKCRQRKCRCCRQWFLPQAHNAYHQRYCTEQDCRRASKRASQRRWLLKNRDHYRGDINVTRVQVWRAAHPGYARGQSRAQRLLLKLQKLCGPRRSHRIRLRIDHPQSGALQDLFFPQPAAARMVTLTLECPLQDLIGVSAACCYC